jgi:hypothetical protein
MMHSFCNELKKRAIMARKEDGIQRVSVFIDWSVDRQSLRGQDRGRHALGVWHGEHLRLVFHWLLQNVESAKHNFWINMERIVDVRQVRLTPSMQCDIWASRLL